MGEGGRVFPGGVPVALLQNPAWSAASLRSVWRSASSMILRMSRRRAAGVSTSAAPAIPRMGRPGAQRQRRQRRRQEGPGDLRRSIQAPTPTCASRPGRRGNQSGEAAVRLAEPRSQPPGLQKLGSPEGRTTLGGEDPRAEGPECLGRVPLSWPLQGALRKHLIRTYL